MQICFHVLASGSSGNSCVVEAGDARILVDFGLAARTLTKRLQTRGLGWPQINAAILSHTHGDHWQAGVLSQLVEHRIPLYCHAGHVPCLEGECAAFAELVASGLVHYYEPGQRLNLHADCDCVPIAIRHDAAGTCAFRLESPSSGERGWAIGYATDLGCWTPALARQFADVDLLGLEFNHDVRMQLASRRPAMLVRRVLGDRGHLSNDQAASLLAEVIACSEPGRLRTLVQLHLSRDCNCPDLARTVALQTADRLGVTLDVHTVPRGRVGPTIRIDPTASARRPRPSPLPRFVQPLLFGADS